MRRIVEKIAIVRQMQNSPSDLKKGGTTSSSRMKWLYSNNLVTERMIVAMHGHETFSKTCCADTYHLGKLLPSLMAGLSRHCCLKKMT